MTVVNITAFTAMHDIALRKTIYLVRWPLTVKANQSLNDSGLRMTSLHTNTFLVRPVTLC